MPKSLYSHFFVARSILTAFHRRCLASMAVGLISVFSLATNADTALTGKIESKARDSKTSSESSVHLAVAANFGVPIRKLAEMFEQQTGYKTVISVGSTGKLAAQIHHGAPYDLFLAADDETPTTLVSQHVAIADTAMTYAIGKLVLWGPNITKPLTENTLKQGEYTTLAYANPRLAPYGRAAQEVMQTLAIKPSAQQRWVTGESIAQTFQFVRSGNADIGFIALSQVMPMAPQKRATLWKVPENMYQPIRQNAVLLTRANNNTAAHAFLAFLKSPIARHKIREFGYSTP